ncbi:hypothetical protein NQ317_015671 [Molorchus minor]|uniref:Fork-head domain-containing protein n=1 Tax=Molorchus minor TaxID=1323400 RepID=A0ABQ9J0N1_9CUCU|nr:hypothetical protein NQ317_015671 [Molorchus minor]
MAPERPVSPQAENVMTPKMSVPGSPVAGTPRDAHSPISILLAVAQSQNRCSDDDLTSLNWLHERDLLKGMNINPSPSSSLNSTPEKSFNNNILMDRSPASDYVDDSSISAADSSHSSVNSPTPYQNQHKNAVCSKVHIPYDPLVHTYNKPPYSFSCLIFMAIEDSVQKALPVKEIYAWILDHFPYFRDARTGWKNSVRHNLSLNKCFQKVEKAPNLGKGSLWTVDPQYRPNLIQALNRCPFHPRSTPDSDETTRPAVTDKSTMYRLPNPNLFPFLSRKLAATENKQDIIIKQKEPFTGAKQEDSLDAADAAVVMLSLKNGPRVSPKKENSDFQVITTSPSQDHTYSAADNVESGNGDGAFESDEDRLLKRPISRKLNFEDDEERRIKEGAETLLNLAGINTANDRIPIALVLNRTRNQKNAPCRMMSAKVNQKRKLHHSNLGCYVQREKTTVKKLYLTITMMNG